MTGRMKTLVGLAICLGSFLAGWIVNGWQADAVISGIRTEHAAQVAINASKALERYETMERTKDEAIKAAQERETQFKADSGRASATADGLRKQLASVPTRIATASRAAVDEYANTAGELLGACTSEYQWMARKADEHANAERTLIDAWPRSQ